MEITETLYVTDRKEWRAWLRANYKTKKAIWLVYYNKKSGKPRIPYNDAVEEALCFGWIDSTVKKVDDDRAAQRFTPRNPKSGYSEPNKERLRMMMAKGKVVKELREKITEIIADESYEYPADIIEAIKADKDAWKHYQKFPENYRRIRVDYIHHARIRPDEFERRLKNFIRKTAQNKKFGQILVD